MKLNTAPLSGIEIGIPTIAEGNYHARIAKVEVKANKTGDGNNLVIQYKILDNPVLSYKDGKEIENKGQIVSTRYYSLKPTPDYDPNKNLKELAVAIKHPEDQDLEETHLKDKMVMVKVVHKPEEKDEKSGKTYPAGNDVARVTPVPEDDPFTPPPF